MQMLFDKLDELINALRRSILSMVVVKNCPTRRFLFAMLNSNFLFLAPLTKLHAADFTLGSAGFKTIGGGMAALKAGIGRTSHRIGLQLPSQLRLDLLNRWQAALELGGHGLGDVLLPVGDGDGLVEAAEGILDDELVFAPAEQEADGGLIVGVAQEIVHGGAVEIELADIAGLEGAGFQLDDDVAAQTQVVEQQVEIEVIATDLQMNTPADKGETCPQLQQEALDVVHERLLDLGLAAGIGGAYEVEEVGVFEDRGGHV
jgi:hypothetical protein